MRYAMIMAGGAGTRLWPMSRRGRPKQLLPQFNGRSLLELAADRVTGLVEPDHRLICTGESFRKPILAAIPEFKDEQILGEPVGRDTVNAIGFTAAVLMNQDPNAVFAVLTADHLIEPVNEFKKKIETGFRLTEENHSRIVTFSINPTYPATGYGYVERGDAISGFDDAFAATRFVEKPDGPTAKSYIKAGNFGWNSGMFVFSARKFMEALNWHLPENYQGLLKIAEAWGTKNQLAILNDVYPSLKKISVDYAVMEPASRDDRLDVCTVLFNITWMDVGNWVSYGETLNPDSKECRTNANATHVDSKNVLAVSDDPNHAITTIDCEDLIVVHTKDATLVCPKGSAERVKELADKVDDKLK